MKLSPDEMARRLCRHRSTIFRELRRNLFHDNDIPKLSGYWCFLAQSYSNGRRTRQRKLVRDPGLCDQVERCLRFGWTPEQIAGRMRYENAPRRLCQETIYQHIYADLFEDNFVFDQAFDTKEKALNMFLRDHLQQQPRPYEKELFIRALEGMRAHKAAEVARKAGGIPNPTVRRGVVVSIAAE